MRKIIFLIILIIAVGFISGSKKPGQSGMVKIYSKALSVKESKDLRKNDLSESGVNSETSSQVDALKKPPRILLILQNDTGRSDWSPSLWWSYEPNKVGKPGC